MSIEEISRLAIELSSSLNAQEMEERALQSEANLKGRWQNPQIMGQFGTLKTDNQRGSTIEMSLTQPVPLSDKYSIRKEMALIALDNQKKQTHLFEKWVSHQAILATWKMYLTSKLLNHGALRTKRIRLVKKYLEVRPKVTIKQRVELSIITSTLYELEKMQDLKKYDYEMAKNNMQFWIGKNLSDSEIPFSLPDHYEFFDDYNLDISKDLELNLAKSLFHVSQMDNELAGKERRPDLFLGVGHRVENVVPQNQFNYAIVGLNIPLWDTGIHRLESARAREARDRKKLEEIEKQTYLKHQKQIELVKLSIEQLKRYPKKYIDQNERIIEEAEVGFRQGLLDVNTFLLAETQSYEVIDQIFLSWYSYLENLSSFQLMRGEEFKWEFKK
jgi:hypothetical protein